MQLLFGHDQAVARWAGERLGGSGFPERSIGIGIIDDSGVLRGAFVLTHWNDFTAEFSLYSEGALTLGVLRQFFFHVFLRLGVSRLQIHTPRNNKAVKKAAPKWGFQWDGVSKSCYGPGRDGLRFYMTAQHCRWIKNHGLPLRRQTKSAKAA